MFSQFNLFGKRQEPVVETEAKPKPKPRVKAQSAKKAPQVSGNVEIDEDEDLRNALRSHILTKAEIDRKLTIALNALNEISVGVKSPQVHAQKALLQLQ